jgi:hypothetical protein
MNTHQYPAGTILLFEEGAYSDFSYCGQLVTLKPLNLPGAIQEFKDTYEPKNDWDKPEPDKFVAWLCLTQRCAQLECQTVHIGSYGDLSL